MYSIKPIGLIIIQLVEACILVESVATALHISS